MPDEPSPETGQYRGLVQIITETTNWKRQFQSPSLDTKIERISDGHTVEMFYEIPETEGQVHVRLPGEKSDTVGDLLLDIPLGDGLEWNDGGFVGQLCATHKAIAKRHQTDYCTPVADTSLVMRSDIPKNYTKETVATSLQAFINTAAEVTALHNDLILVLEEYR